MHPLRHGYHPRLVVAASDFPPAAGSPALLDDRPLLNGMPTAYVCHDFICQRPVNSVQEMLQQLG
jgi:uncharacterized protein YyaL (SSP411 family)